MRKRDCRTDAGKNRQWDNQRVRQADSEPVSQKVRQAARQDCLIVMMHFSTMSYTSVFLSVPLKGTDMTPNYEDANHTDFSISPWCSCRNSGNQEEECEKFLRDFRENVCLRKNHVKNCTAVLKNPLHEQNYYFPLWSFRCHTTPQAPPPTVWRWNRIKKQKVMQMILTFHGKLKYVNKR